MKRSRRHHDNGFRALDDGVLFGPRDEQDGALSETLAHPDVIQSADARTLRAALSGDRIDGIAETHGVGLQPRADAGSDAGQLPRGDGTLALRHPHFPGPGLRLSGGGRNALREDVSVEPSKGRSFGLRCIGDALHRRASGNAHHVEALRLVGLDAIDAKDGGVRHHNGKCHHLGNVEGRLPRHAGFVAREFPKIVGVELANRPSETALPHVVGGHGKFPISKPLPQIAEVFDRGIRGPRGVHPFVDPAIYGEPIIAT